MVEAPESKLVSDTGESPAQGKLRSENVCHAMICYAVHFNASKMFQMFHHVLHQINAYVHSFLLKES